MNDELFRLVYLSQNEINGDDSAVQQEIAQILSSARITNQEYGVTGALMFNSVCFAQVLEGEYAKVQTIFERIQCDFRHSDVVILDTSAIVARGFEQWSMAYLSDTDSKIAEFDSIASSTQFNPELLSGDLYALVQPAATRPRHRSTS